MATILENESAWSTTAATNANVDTGINWAENQDAATREQFRPRDDGRAAQGWLDQGGERVATGTPQCANHDDQSGADAPTHFAAG